MARGMLKGSRREPAAVKLVRDPVCGIFVVPGKALTSGRGTRRSTSVPRSAATAVERAGDAAEAQLRAEIVEVGRRLYARGYTASNDGNISVRLDADRLLMTPKSVCKGFMTPEMMCITDLDGRKLAGERDPSSEMQMHLEVYRQRPGRAGGRARAPADRDRVRRRRHSARSRGARRGGDDARQRADCGVRDAVDEGAAGGGPASTSRRTTACCWPTTAR